LLDAGPLVEGRGWAIFVSLLLGKWVILVGTSLPKPPHPREQVHAAIVAKKGGASSVPADLWVARGRARLSSIGTREVRRSTIICRSIVLAARRLQHLGLAAKCDFELSAVFFGHGQAGWHAS
jgi:hypothetical protein